MNQNAPFDVSPSVLQMLAEGFGFAVQMLGGVLSSLPPWVVVTLMLLIALRLIHPADQRDQRRRAGAGAERRRRRRRRRWEDDLW